MIFLIFWGPFEAIMTDLGLSRRHSWILACSKDAQRCLERSIAHLGAVFGDFDVGEDLPECHPEILDIHLQYVFNWAITGLHTTTVNADDDNNN